MSASTHGDEKQKVADQFVLDVANGTETAAGFRDRIVRFTAAMSKKAARSQLEASPAMMKAIAGTENHAKVLKLIRVASELADVAQNMAGRFTDIIDTTKEVRNKKIKKSGITDYNSADRASDLLHEALNKIKRGLLGAISQLNPPQFEKDKDHNKIPLLDTPHNQFYNPEKIKKDNVYTPRDLMIKATIRAIAEIKDSMDGAPSISFQGGFVHWRFRVSRAMHIPAVRDPSGSATTWLPAAAFRGEISIRYRRDVVRGFMFEMRLIPADGIDCPTLRQYVKAIDNLINRNSRISMTGLASRASDVFRWPINYLNKFFVVNRANASPTAFVDAYWLIVYLCATLTCSIDLEAGVGGAVDADDGAIYIDRIAAQFLSAANDPASIASWKELFYHADPKSKTEQEEEVGRSDEDDDDFIVADSELDEDEKEGWPTNAVKRRNSSSSPDGEPSPKRQKGDSDSDVEEVTPPNKKKKKKAVRDDSDEEEPIETEAEQDAQAEAEDAAADASDNETGKNRFLERGAVESSKEQIAAEKRKAEEDELISKMDD